MENTTLLQENNVQGDDQDNARTDPIPPDWTSLPTPAVPKPDRAAYEPARRAELDVRRFDLHQLLNYLRPLGNRGNNMVEGFWILKIQPPPVTRGGLIMFTRGRVFGGDNAFTWVGTYSMSDRVLKGRVRVHKFDPKVKSVLGLNGDYDMHFSGILSGDLITGTAMIANKPQHSLRMEKYAQL